MFHAPLTPYTSFKCTVNKCKLSETVHDIFHMKTTFTCNRGHILYHELNYGISNPFQPDFRPPLTCRYTYRDAKCLGKEDRFYWFSLPFETFSLWQGLLLSHVLPIIVRLSDFSLLFWLSIVTFYNLLNIFGGGEWVGGEEGKLREAKWEMEVEEEAAKWAGHFCKWTKKIEAQSIY